MQIEESSGDRGEGREIHGVGFPSCRVEPNFQKCIRFLRALDVTLELSIVESLQEFVFFCFVANISFKEKTTALHTDR